MRRTRRRTDSRRATRGEVVRQADRSMSAVATTTGICGGWNHRLVAPAVLTFPHERRFCPPCLFSQLSAATAAVRFPGWCRPRSLALESQATGRPDHHPAVYEIAAGLARSNGGSLAPHGTPASQFAADRGVAVAEDQPREPQQQPRVQHHQNRPQDLRRPGKAATGPQQWQAEHGGGAEQHHEDQPPRVEPPPLSNAPVRGGLARGARCCGSGAAARATFRRGWQLGSAGGADDRVDGLWQHASGNGCQGTRCGGRSPSRS